LNTWGGDRANSGRKKSDEVVIKLQQRYTKEQVKEIKKHAEERNMKKATFIRDIIVEKWLKRNRKK
jgi:hypothetical protein